MSCQEEVIKIGKKLEKMISSNTEDHATAIDLLNTLKKLPMTLDVLQKTHIGMTVNNFRKSTNKEEAVSIAKSLIKSWKKLLSAGTNSQSNTQALERSSSTSSTVSTPDVSKVETNSATRTEDKREEEEESVKDSENNRTEKKDTPDDGSSSKDTENNAALLYDERPKAVPLARKAPETSDSVRLKCRDMLASALNVDGQLEGCNSAEDVAAAIEDCIFDENLSTNVKYKNKVRSRYANLKDLRNPHLRRNVLSGVIPPSKIAVMTAEEMANDELKEARAKFTKESIDDHQMSTTSGTKTDLLKCGKCGKRNCTYNQVQTRSADEPMTTFCFCNECGNRWKFC